jgi:ElaB/YqjD/DUF883 family membrane-anchored ribosome-binding protein
MAELKMPEIKFDELAAEVTKIMKDVVYISVGFGVLAFQKAQVQRTELQKRLGARLDNGKSEWEKAGKNLEAQLKTIETRLEELEGRFDGALDQLQEKLPGQAAELMGQARGAVKSARQQVIDRVKRDEATAA